MCSSGHIKYQDQDMMSFSNVIKKSFSKTHRWVVIQVKIKSCAAMFGPL